MPVGDFADRCYDALPRIPSATLYRIIVECARELERYGRLWRYAHPDITVDESNLFPLDKPDCALIHDIDVVMLDERPIYSLSLGRSVPAPLEVQWQRVGDSIRLTQKRASGVLRVQSVLISKPDAEDLPQILWDEWVEVMEHGAKAKAMLIPNEAWSNPQTALYHESEWSNGLRKAKTYGRAGGITARRRTVDPFARDYRATRGRG